MLVLFFCNYVYSYFTQPIQNISAVVYTATVCFLKYLL
jgi:hypothetical protein